MIKLGIIGTNWITQQFIDAIKLSDQYQLTTVYSRSMEHATEFGKHNGATEFYDDLEMFFEQGIFDTVYIASPNSLHFEQAKLAINHEKNVIVEKPAFANQKEMTLIQEELKKFPRVLYFEAARQIHTENFKALALQVSKMDQISGANFTYEKYSSRYDDVLAGKVPNVFSPKFAGGALQDLGVYTVYDAVALFGMPEEVAYYPQLIDTGVDGKGTAILQYPEFTVVLNFGKIVNSYMTSEIYGLKDTIEIDDAGEIEEVVYIDQDKTRHVIGNVDEFNPMFGEIKDFAKIINDPQDPDNQLEYERLRELSINVNKLLFNLRQDAHLKFPND
ncbi:Gfo/Idh/MocA family protein [Lentilactobacillus laojiaonis]|uniref:Gfo/Idh/MocA family protein n=1 Tax=Lentilactobacillus laojiaonis TaxID=2883998 RepID=UPI001D0BD306|nr:Gfo/Idh/MocA family oxidoreductase [Lentilactobacillus laojiaonis]UDM32423.1 Gfo/Idh/MocA family oxidoreductase [Lentilactobacillus laojiaonis]